MDYGHLKKIIFDIIYKAIITIYAWLYTYLGFSTLNIFNMLCAFKIVKHSQMHKDLYLEPYTNMYISL